MFKNQLNNYDARIYKLTSTGDTLWKRRIPGAPANNNICIKDIAATPDRRLSVIGLLTTCIKAVGLLRQIV
ncbi:hypothetical protein C7N43_29180 [Sphingobacteriales bacterium UPWRP_1]|nr:hypothetical protein C7N43_29180 [Sphingobacteriales bacterium UPWRP_1]